MGWVKLQDINFLALQSAVFCVQCELISENNTPACLACGSQAVLSLSRVLGGSLRGQQTANVIADAELNRLVRDLLRTVPNHVRLQGMVCRRHSRALLPAVITSGQGAQRADCPALQPAALTPKSTRQKSISSRRSA